MVSPLWKACSDGDLDKVIQLLNDPSPVDIELKDHTGVTPLIEAVKNGHLQVVRLLLTKGADPENASSHGKPEQYTSDPSIIELLTSTTVPNGNPSHENPYAHQNGNDHSDKRYYAPPPPSAAYTYYPTINPSLSTVGEVAGFYPPTQQSHQFDENSAANGLGHLPPPEIARLIPCRYFPACRYGPQCMFAHPQAPYFQGGTVPPLPQFSPYDPMGASYGYFPPPPFQQVNGTQITSLSPPPQPHIMHGRSPSEIVSPSQPQFSPSGPIPPNPYGPLSPNTYHHPGQVPVPMTLPPLPPLPHQLPLSGPGPQSPSAMYNNAPIVPPFHGPDASSQYMPPPPPAGVGYPDIDGTSTSPPFGGQHDGYNVHPIHRDGAGHRRGGVPRRGSFAGRKPPCLFFPSGRCKNGDECRFPHVLPDNSGPHHAHAYFSPRGGAPRPRGHNNGNGVATVEQKLGSLTVRDDAPRVQNGAADGSSRSHSTDPGNRPKFQQGLKHQPGNAVHNHRKFAPNPKPQRVPNADEFPVLPGSLTPPNRTNGMNGALNGNGHHGPTAAQVLQAPPPARRENGKDSSTRGATPESVRSTESDTTNAAPVNDQPAQKLSVSFAAAATAAPDVSKEISVSA